MPAGNKRLALTGFLLIAAAYGLARFSWGLLLPGIRQDIPLSLSVAGTLASASFAAYCVAVIFASVCTAKTGPRFPSLLAGLCAVAGTAIIAFSHGAAGLMAGVICAGLSAGLVSPPMAEAVNRNVASGEQPVVNTIINAGTGGGVIFSALAVLALTDNWRATYLFFACVSLIPTLLALKTLPAGASGETFSLKTQFAAFLAPALRPPLVVAFLSGIASAAYWSFGPVMFTSQAGANERTITLLWLITGVTGCFGLVTGYLTNRFGVNAVHRMMQALTVAAFVLFIFASRSPLVVYLVAALYGFAYITLSGVLLVSGVNATADKPAAGLGAVFLMLAIGQVAGAAAFGLLLDSAGAVIALLIFSAVALLAMLLPVARTQKGDVVDAAFK